MVRRKLMERMDELALTQERLAHAIGSHPKSVGRWVRGLTTPGAATRQALARELKWTPAQLHLALSDEDTPPNGHSVPNDFTHFASCEQGATLLQTLNSVTLPGLLQTPAYADAVEREWPLGASEDDVARRVRQRLARQRVLDASLRLMALVDRSVLLRVTGSPDVMAAQVEHLRRLNQRANVEIRILPLDQRGHPAGQGSFVLFTGEDRQAPYMVATHNALGPEYWELPTMVMTYVALFDHLWSVSDELEEVDLLV
jgi:hypothetical protein